MEADNKIELGAVDLLARHHKAVEAAAKLAVRKALRRHAASGTPIAVSVNGEAVLRHPRPTHLDALARIWDNEEDEVYAELLQDKE